MQIALHDYDPNWPAMFDQEHCRVTAAVGPVALEVHHVGSTSVPGLAAKPVLDIVLAVPDSTDEAVYVPALKLAGYVFVLREADWFEHRLLRREPGRVNLHVFTAGCMEIAVMIGFRDWLRSHPDDRDLYERAKRSLAVREWSQVQDYADAKSEVISEIQRRVGMS
ncbi:MAG: GrpB family protein [Ilumatobacteraceae bacterium]